jgi:hypothetical protein
MGEVDSSMSVEIMFLSFAVSKLDALDPKSGQTLALYIIFILLHSTSNKSE